MQSVAFRTRSTTRSRCSGLSNPASSASRVWCIGSQTLRRHACAKKRSNCKPHATSKPSSHQLIPSRATASGANSCCCRSIAGSCWSRSDTTCGIWHMDLHMLWAMHGPWAYAIEIVADFHFWGRQPHGDAKSRRGHAPCAMRHLPGAVDHGVMPCHGPYAVCHLPCMP